MGGIDGEVDSDPREVSARLIRTVAPLHHLVVGFSGGVDSTVLAYAALRALGSDRVLAVTADSPSLARDELDHCRSVADELDLPWRSITTRELSDERYRANDGDRCYWCKDALMDVLVPLADDRGAEVAIGVNLDDLGDHRPGQLAARRRGARFPLVEAGLDKRAIRAVARDWNLSTWNKPAMPCLASRIPYGTPVSARLLTRLDRAEAALRGLGFGDVRVRHYGRTARVEVPASELVTAASMAATIAAALRAVGYEYVTLDLDGL